MATKGRKLESIIDTFVATTGNLGAPPIFRKWTAISMIAAATQQRVWVKTSRPLFPNLYIITVAFPGVGKTRTLMEAKHLLSEIKGLHPAPINMTAASIVDAVAKAKIEVLTNPGGKSEFNSLYIIADEIGAFLAKYDNEMIALLTAFYDPTPYHQTRRTGGADDRGIDIMIKSPQLNILTGATPDALLHLIPEYAWGQGLTSRIIMVFSDERTIVDDFADHPPIPAKDLIHDLTAINSLYGGFTVTPAYREAVNEWKNAGCVPIPHHPKLEHYCTRRPVHVYRLSMISSLNRDSSLYLTEEDFFTAVGWLVEAETFMPDIFKAGAASGDTAALTEIVHFIGITDVAKTGVSEHRIIKFASERLPIQTVPRVIEILEGSGQIVCIRKDKHTGARFYSITSRQTAGKGGLSVIAGSKTVPQ